MHKNVIIPTDFQVTSLVTIKKVIADLKEGDTVSIKLVHGYQLNDSITDLLFYSRRTLYANLVPQDFLESCQVIQNKHNATVTNLDIEFFHGGNAKALKQFCDKRRINLAYIPVGQNPVQTHKRSFDLIPLLDKLEIKKQSCIVNTAVEMPMERVSEFILNEMNA